MSGTYPVFPLQLVVVFNLTTCFIRNALAVSPLAAGVAAVDRIRPLGSKGFSTALANPILSFFQSPLFQIFLITPVPAQMVIAIFLGADLRVEDPPAPFANDPPHSQVRFRTGDFFLIPLSQRFLIFIFPITVPHCLSASFPMPERKSGPKSVPVRSPF